MGMREDPHILRQGNLIADRHAAFRVNKHAPVEKDKITDLEILPEIESEILLSDESGTALFKKPLGEQSPEKDAEICAEADRQFIKGIPDEMKVTLLRRKGIFASQGKELAVKSEFFEKFF